MNTNREVVSRTGQRGRVDGPLAIRIVAACIIPRDPLGSLEPLRHHSPNLVKSSLPAFTLPTVRDYKATVATRLEMCSIVLVKLIPNSYLRAKIFYYLEKRLLS